MLNMNALIFLAFASVAHCIKFHIVNNAGGAIDVGILGNDGKPNLENGGFTLQQGETKTVDAPDDWQGRFWPRTYCDPNSHHCETGDCGNKVQCQGAGGVPPATLAEITLRGSGGQDFYDLSLVDGFNLPASIEPVGGDGDCKPLKCSKDLNPGCPEPLQLKGSSGDIIGCLSSCTKFNTDQYCCRGEYGTKDTCPTSDWEVNSADYFKKNCPDAYSYAYDDNTSLFTCVANEYKIIFG